MKKKWILLCVAALSLFSACGVNENNREETGGYTTQTSLLTEKPAMKNTPTPVPTVTEIPEIVKTGYNGDLSSYTYRYSEGRNYDWEQDILFFAGMYLGDENFSKRGQGVSKRGRLSCSGSGYGKNCCIIKGCTFQCCITGE